MRNRTLLVAVVVAIVAIPATLHAGANSGAKAWLSWDSTSVVCDLPEMPTGPTWLYVQLGDVTDLTACEFDLKWLPLGAPGSGCYEFLSGEHPSGSGDDCTWMMRGSQVEGMNDHGDGYWGIAFAGDECSTCGTGNVARMLLDFSSCYGGASARLCLQYVILYDCSGGRDAGMFAIGSATILGGAGAECPCYAGLDPYCPDCDWAVSVEGSTWGAVKALYK